MDDGTLAAGCYDGEGNWRSVTAEQMKRLTGENRVGKWKKDRRGK